MSIGKMIKKVLAEAEAEVARQNRGVGVYADYDYESPPGGAEIRRRHTRTPHQVNWWDRMGENPYAEAPDLADLWQSVNTPFGNIRVPTRPPTPSRRPERERVAIQDPFTYGQVGARDQGERLMVRRARGGRMTAPGGGALSQMMADAGASESLLKDVERVEDMPGGQELLYTVAAEEAMKNMGATKKDVKKLRLFNLGDEEAFQEGGLAQASGNGLTPLAETVREGGRGEDSMLVHMSPDEFDAITAMWGTPDTNPVTGLPEYGFLSKVWKKIKKGVKKIVKSKIFQTIAPIALSIFVPGLGAAIGGALGASGAAASMVGNAVIQGGLGAAAGGKEGFIKGALSGAVAGGLGKAAGKAVGLKGTTADVVGSALIEGTGSKLSGGDFTTGAISGGLSAAIRPTQERLVGRAREMVGTAPKTTLNPVTGEPIAVGDDPALIAQREAGITGYSDPAAEGFPVPGADGVTGGAAGTSAARENNLADMALKYGLPLAGMLGGTGGGEVAPEGPPELPPEFYSPLPEYTLDRTLRTPQDYFTYGQAGGPTQEEATFLSDSQFRTPDTGVDVGGGAPIAPETQGPRRLRGGRYGLIERATLEKQGWTYDPSTQMMHPPQQTIAGQTAYRGGKVDTGLNELRFATGGRYYKGAGSGRDDTIEALLSDGEYVMDAETVAMIGDGSNDEGAKRLDTMRENLRKHKGENLRRGKFSHDAKDPVDYLPARAKRRVRKEHGGTHNLQRGGRPKRTRKEDELVLAMAQEMGVA